MSDVSISGDALALTGTFVDAIEPVIAQQSRRVRRSVAETYPYLRVTSSDSPLKEQVPDAMRAVASAAYVEGYKCGVADEVRRLQDEVSRLRAFHALYLPHGDGSGVYEVGSSIDGTAGETRFKAWVDATPDPAAALRELAEKEEAERRMIAAIIDLNDDEAERRAALSASNGGSDV